MSERVDVTDFVTEVAPQIADKIDPATKETVGHLLDHYSASGWSSDDLATVMSEQVSLRDATAEEFDGVVAVVSASVWQQGEEKAHDWQHEQHAQTGDSQTGHAQEHSDEATLEQLAAALGEDTVEAINAASPEFIARSIAELWQEVRAKIEEEVRADPQNWPTKEAAFETAYAALIEAVDGFFDAGESDGGFAALLSRPQS